MDHKYNHRNVFTTDSTHLDPCASSSSSWHLHCNECFQAYIRTGTITCWVHAGTQWRNPRGNSHLLWISFAFLSNPCIYSLNLNQTGSDSHLLLYWCTFWVLCWCEERRQSHTSCAWRWQHFWTSNRTEVYIIVLSHALCTWEEIWSTRIHCTNHCSSFL